MAKFNRILQIFFPPKVAASLAGYNIDHRYQRAALTTIVMVAFRISNIVIGLLTVPITLRYLGEDLFGIWMVLMSLVGILSFYDFGIGTGLRNILIECSAKDDLESPKIFIGNALFLLTVLALLMIVIVCTVLPFAPWGDLIKCKDPTSLAEILPTAQAVLFMFALGLPISQLQQIANAYQRGYLGYLCLLFGRVFAFFFILWCVNDKQPLWVLAGGYVGIPFFVTLIGWLVFLRVAPAYRPWPIYPRWDVIHRLFGIGFYVLVHHLSYAMIHTSGVLLIANTISSASTIAYSVTNQLLGVSNILTSSLLVGVSVAVGESWHRKEYHWVKTIIRRSEISTFLFAIIPLFLLLLLGQSFIFWWTKSHNAVPSLFLLTSCVLLAAASSIGSIYADCLLAMNHVRFIAITRFLAGVVVLICGYICGVLFQSSAIIAFIQFFVGAFLPAFIFFLRMKRLLSSTECSRFMINPRCSNTAISDVSVRQPISPYH